ncbi:hypothetical protein L7F22_029081 [Adiantum nelumboides]|nr:hypothetical protein [Adiantum nelumboides]
MDSLKMAHLMAGCDQEEVKLRAFPLVLKGKARVWYDALASPSKATWPTLYGAFLNKYGQGDTLENLWKQLLQHRQGSLGDYVTYESKFTNLWERWTTSLQGQGGAPNFLKRDKFVEVEESSDEGTYGDEESYTSEESSMEVMGLVFRQLQAKGSSTSKEVEVMVQEEPMLEEQLRKMLGKDLTKEEEKNYINMFKSSTEEDHLEKVFDFLREHNLFAKESKCDFLKIEIQYLGHVISSQGVHMDMSKVDAIVHWPHPTNLEELQIFLGLASFYREYVRDYAKIFVPMTDQLKATEKLQHVKDVLQDHMDMLKLPCQNIRQAQDWYKKYADEKRRQVVFKEGLRGLIAGFIAQTSCDVLHNNKIKGKKPIFFKHLNDFWNKCNGQFGPQNTLLVDDSLYKCIFNFSGNCCIVPAFGSPNDTTQRPFLTHKLAPWLYKYLQTGDRMQFVIGGGDVFGTWGSAEDLIVKDLIELHGHRSLKCCYHVRWGKIEKKTFEEI